MKCRHTMLIAACLAAAPIVHGAQQLTSNIAVSATVASVCTLDTGPLIFPTYTGAEVITATSVVVTCPVGVPFSFTLGPGLSPDGAMRRMSGPGPNRLGYTVTYSVGGLLIANLAPNHLPITSSGAGGAFTFPLEAKIPASQTVNPGSYSDTIVVTLSF